MVKLSRLEWSAYTLEEGKSRTYRSVPHANLFVPACGHHPAALFVDNNVAHKVWVFQGHVGFPPVLPDQAFGGFIRRRCPEVSVVIKEELVDAGIVGQQWFRRMVAAKDAELPDLSITASAEHRRF